jgi:hypothetical protein
MVARKKGQLRLPGIALHSAQRPVILSTEQNIDTFPFNSGATEARKQQIVERKRAETPALRSLAVKTSLVRSLPSVVVEKVQRSNLSARLLAATLHYNRASGFVQDLNRLSGSEKDITVTALKRSVLVGSQKIVTRKLKPKGYTPRSFQTVLGGA